MVRLLPVRSEAAIDFGNRMIETLEAADFAADRSLQLLRVLNEFTTGHVLATIAARMGGSRRCRKPDPASPEYNSLARSAELAPPGAHFGPGLAMVLDGFSAQTVTPGPPAAAVSPPSGGDPISGGRGSRRRSPSP